MESVFVSMVVVAMVELLRRLQARDYIDALTIVGAGIIGAVAGYFHIDGLTVTNGILAGLSASGIVTIAKAMGGK
jgi:hypothetical protein